MKTLQTVCDQKRRSFLKLSGLLGLGMASGALLSPAKAEAVLFTNKEYKVTKTRLSMGTFVAMTAIHPSRDEAEHAIGLAFEEIDRLNALLTRFESSSPVGELNASGKLTEVPAEIQELVARSLYYNRATSGAFDITVKPLIDLYKDSFSAGKKPSDKQVAETLRLVGMEKVRFNAGKLLLADSSMGITLDGIAKGYIVDRASEVLSASGVKNHLINGGGDIRTSGSSEKGKPWKVAIQNPKKEDRFPSIISMKDGAVATSGNYEIYYDQEKMFHHIVDSRTGYSPQLPSSVTVMAPTVMDADALSTSVFVMEAEAGTQLIDTLPGCESFLLDKKGQVTHSRGWQV